jgi:hypothetical protein
MFSPRKQTVHVPLIIRQTAALDKAFFASREKYKKPGRKSGQALK